MRPAPSAGAPRVSPAFERLAAALAREGLVDDGTPASAPRAGARRFGSDALTTGGAIYAMPVRGALVVKLPRARVAALVASGAGAPYDAGRGRALRAWVLVADPAADWLGLAREARAFVGAGGPRRRPARVADESA